MKYLAIDYGTKRIGIAVSRLFLAEPCIVLDRDVAVEKLVTIIQQEQPDALVLGIADGPMVEQGRKFAQEVISAFEKSGLSSRKSPLQIIEVDETLSSVEAQFKMRTSGMSQSKRRGDIDHFAAAAFLQEYMDTHKEKA